LGGNKITKATNDCINQKKRGGRKRSITEVRKNSGGGIDGKGNKRPSLNVFLFSIGTPNVQQQVNSLIKDLKGWKKDPSGKKRTEGGTPLKNSTKTKGKNINAKPKKGREGRPMIADQNTRVPRKRGGDPEDLTSARQGMDTREWEG